MLPLIVLALVPALSHCWSSGEGTVFNPGRAPTLLGKVMGQTISGTPLDLSISSSLHEGEQLTLSLGGDCSSPNACTSDAQSIIRTLLSHPQNGTDEYLLSGFAPPTYTDRWFAAQVAGVKATFDLESGQAGVACAFSTIGDDHFNISSGAHLRRGSILFASRRPTKTLLAMSGLTWDVSGQKYVVFPSGFGVCLVWTGIAWRSEAAQLDHSEISVSLSGVNYVFPAFAWQIPAVGQGWTGAFSGPRDQVQQALFQSPGSLGRVTPFMGSGATILCSDLPAIAFVTNAVATVYRAHPVGASSLPTWAGQHVSMQLGYDFQFVPTADDFTAPAVRRLAFPDCVGLTRKTVWLSNSAVNLRAGTLTLTHANPAIKGYGVTNGSARLLLSVTSGQIMSSTADSYVESAAHPEVVRGLVIAGIVMIIIQLLYVVGSAVLTCLSGWPHTVLSVIVKLLYLLCWSLWWLIIVVWWLLCTLAKLTLPIELLWWVYGGGGKAFRVLCGWHIIQLIRLPQSVHAPRNALLCLHVRWFHFGLGTTRGAMRAAHSQALGSRIMRLTAFGTGYLWWFFSVLEFFWATPDARWSPPSRDQLDKVRAGVRDAERESRLDQEDSALLSHWSDSLDAKRDAEGHTAPRALTLAFLLKVTAVGLALSATPSSALSVDELVPRLRGASSAQALHILATECTSLGEVPPGAASLQYSSFGPCTYYTRGSTEYVVTATGESFWPAVADGTVYFTPWIEQDPLYRGLVNMSVLWIAATSAEANLGGQHGTLPTGAAFPDATVPDFGGWGEFMATAGTLWTSANFINDALPPPRKMPAFWDGSTMSAAAACQALAYAKSDGSGYVLQVATLASGVIPAQSPADTNRAFCAKVIAEGPDPFFYWAAIVPGGNAPATRALASVLLDLNGPEATVTELAVAGGTGTGPISLARGTQLALLSNGAVRLVSYPQFGSLPQPLNMQGNLRARSDGVMAFVMREFARGAPLPCATGPSYARCLRMRSADFYGSMALDPSLFATWLTPLSESLSTTSVTEGTATVSLNPLDGGVGVHRQWRISEHADLQTTLPNVPQFLRANSATTPLEGVSHNLTFVGAVPSCASSPVPVITCGLTTTPTQLPLPVAYSDPCAGQWSGGVAGVGAPCTPLVLAAQRPLARYSGQASQWQLLSNKGSAGSSGTCSGTGAHISGFLSFCASVSTQGGCSSRASCLFSTLPRPTSGSETPEGLCTKQFFFTANGTATSAVSQVTDLSAFDTSGDFAYVSSVFAGQAAPGLLFYTPQIVVPGGQQPHASCFNGWTQPTFTATALLPVSKLRGSWLDASGGMSLAVITLPPPSGAQPVCAKFECFVGEMVDVGNGCAIPMRIEASGAPSAVIHLVLSTSIAVPITCTSQTFVLHSNAACGPVAYCGRDPTANISVPRTGPSAMPTHHVIGGANVRIVSGGTVGDESGSFSFGGVVDHATGLALGLPFGLPNPHELLDWVWRLGVALAVIAVICLGLRLLMEVIRTTNSKKND